MKAGGRNAATLSVADASATLAINGAVTREVELTTDRVFSLVRDKGRASARVRGVVLSGDWPTSVPASLRGDPPK